MIRTLIALLAPVSAASAEGFDRPIPTPQSAPAELWSVSRLAAGADADDVRRGVEHLAARGMIDPARVAALGWSYGATLALRLACAEGADPLLRAVIAGAPVVDWLTVFGAARFPSVTTEYFAARPWDDRAPYDQASPASWSADIAAPTLILAPGDDARVPACHSRLLYRMLRARGATAALARYPGEGHVLSRPAAIRDMLTRTLWWLAQHLGRAEPD